MDESRKQLDDEAIIAFVSSQLEKTAQDMRQLFYRRKDQTEHVMAFIMVRQMRRAGWRIDAPALRAEGAIVGLAMPPKAPDGP